MNKIGIPINADDFTKCVFSSIICLLIGLFFVVESMIVQMGGYNYFLFIPLVFLQYIMIMMLLIVHDKDEWIDKLIPFRLTK